MSSPAAGLLPDERDRLADFGLEVLVVLADRSISRALVEDDQELIDLAVEADLMRTALYDPAIHGEAAGDVAEPGEDMILTWAHCRPLVAALADAPVPRAGHGTPPRP